MPDKLTTRFKAELESRGITASESDISRFLKTKQSSVQGPPSVPAAGGGRSLLEIAQGTGGEQEGGGFFKAAPIQAAGGTLWGLMDAALMGIPGYMTEWDEYFGETAGGRVGKIAGGAVGFLLPMGVLGGAARAGITAVKGTAAITRTAAKAAARTAGKVGLSKELAEQSIKDTLFEDRFIPGFLSKSVMKKTYLPKFAHSADEIEKVDGMVRQGLAGGLKSKFPKATDAEIISITDAAMDAFSNGVHINSLGKWMEKGLNTTFSVADKNIITAYAGRFLDTAVNFSMYNLLHDGIASNMTDKDFDPATDVKDAMMFSLFLPAVEAIGGGGNVKIIRESLGLRTTMKNFNKTMGSHKSIDALDDKTANGLLRILSRDNFLRDKLATTTIGKDAARFSYGVDLKNGKAQEGLKEIAGIIDIPSLWKDFAKYAGKDLYKSLARMTIGGAYFNMHTLMDRDMMSRMPSDELISHFLVGMMFTKTRKPIYPDPHPTLTNFQERRHALDLFGMDASGIEHYANAYSKQMHIGAAYSGLLGSESSKRISSIINTPENIEQMGKLEGKIGRTGLNERHNLVNWAFDIYNLHELSQKAHESEPTTIVRLKDLTPKQITVIDAKLREMVVNKETGEKLNEDNFFQFKDELLKGSLKGVGEMHLEYIVRGARSLGVNHDWDLKNEIDLDKPIAVGRIPGIENYVGRKGYEDIVKWHQIRDIFEEAGFIKDVIAPPGETRQAKDLLDVGKDELKKLKNDLELTIDKMKQENYGLDASKEIYVNPVDNGFLDALRNYKNGKIQSELFNIVEGGDNLTREQTELREQLKRIIGDRVPKTLEHELAIEIKQPDESQMSKREWEDAVKDGKVDIVRDKIRSLIKIWGVNKEDGPIKAGAGIDYAEARSLVESFENNGINLNRDLASSQNKFFWSRILESGSITSNHIVILEHFKAWDILKFEPRSNGKHAIVLPDENTVRSQLGIKGDLTEKQIEQTMEKYGTILTEIGKARGKYVEVKPKLFIGEKPDNLFGAINDAYVATMGFDEQIGRLKDIGENVDSSDAFYYETSRLINDLMEPIGEGKDQRVVRQLGKDMSNEAAAKELEAVIKRIDILENLGNESNHVPVEDVRLLEQLRTGLMDVNFEAKDVANYESAARKLEEMAMTGVDQNVEFKRLVNNIVFDMANYTHDKIQGKSRMDRFQAHLTKELASFGLEEKEIQDASGNLSDLIAKHAEKGNLSGVMEALSVRLRAWRMGYEEADFMKMVRDNAQHYSDMTTAGMDQNPRYTAQTIRQRYSSWNDRIEGQEFINMQESMRENRLNLDLERENVRVSEDNLNAAKETGDKKLIESATKSFNNATFRLEKSTRALDHARNTLFDEILTAIRLKNGEDSNDIRTWGEKSLKEYDEFVDYMWPSLLATNIGSTTINSAKLNYDKDATPILETTRTPSGRGSLSSFQEEGRNREVTIVKFDSTGVYNSQTVNVNTIDSIEKIIDRAKIAPSSKNVADALGKGEGFVETSVDHLDPFGKPVPVIVSLNTTLIVGSNNLTDGKLNNWFAEFYENKIRSLDGRIGEAEGGAKQRLIRIRDHFRNLYGEFAEVTPEGENRADTNAAAVRAMIRAMYWDRITTSGFEDMLDLAGDSAGLKNVSSTLFKYFSLSEASGAKTQASREFYEELLRDEGELPHLNSAAKILHRPRGALDADQAASIRAILDQGGQLRMVGLADELLSGETKDTPYLERKSAFLSDTLTDKKLKEMLKEHEPGSASYIAAKKQITELRDYLKSIAGVSSVNAHSLLGTNAARVLYLTRGRKLGDTTGRGNTAGVKPTGWFNTPEGSILLKTNFTYDPRIANILDKLGIDILTTQSAAKAFNAPLVEIRASEVPEAKSFHDIIEQSGKFGALGADGTWEPGEAFDNITPNITRIGLENLFIGKTEDRQGVTNVTYAMSDFLSKAGYNSFLENYVKYPEKIREALGQLGNLITGHNRLATADFLMKVLRDEGAIFPESSTSLTESFLKTTVDPDSTLIRPSLERIATKWMVNHLRKPHAEGASYSILVPFLEGTPSVYGEINGKRRQIIFGGKKLAYADGGLKIKNWSNVKYVLNLKHDNELRDVQLARDEHGKWVVDDPFGKLSTDDVKRYTNHIEAIEKDMRDERGESTLLDVHRRLKEVNEGYAEQFAVESEEAQRIGDVKMIRKAQAKQVKFFLHSLTIRMPSLGGDTAIHRVEGFHDEIMGNVVGVNIVDLAVTHQGDFDVDAAASYHDAPQKFSSSIFELAGMAPDAVVYDSEQSPIDVFENDNRSDLRAGTKSSQDGLRDHLAAYQKGKDNFGIMKRVSSSLSALFRQDTMVNQFNGEKIESLNIKDRENFAPFLQRYKNILQTIIDSTKKPNFISNADPNDIKRWLFFNDASGLNLPKDFADNLEKYNEKGFKPLYDLTNVSAGAEREVMQDVIMHTLDKLGRNQRFLSDVFDEGGRRAPDLTEIGQMRADAISFIRDPDTATFLYLHRRYRAGENANKGKKLALEKLFYLGEEGSYSEFSTFRDDMIKKGTKENRMRMPKPVRTVVFFGNKNPNGTPGMYIVNQLKTNHASLTGSSERLNKGKPSLSLRQITEVLNDVEMLSAVLGKEGHKGLTDMLNESDISEAMIDRLSGNMFTTYKDSENKWREKRSDMHPDTVQNYSILYHVLDKQRSSLYKFINSAKGYETASVLRARSRLSAVNATLEFVRNKQDSLVDYVDSKSSKKKDKLVNHFYFGSLNLKAKGSKYTRYENPQSTKMLYVYEEITANGMKRFKKAGFIMPNRSKWLAPGKKYVILKNPVRYDGATTRDALDGYALNEVTGDMEAWNIHGLSKDTLSQRNFINDVETLKGDLGTLAREVYDISHKSPHQMENWQFEQKHEDALVDKFMEKFLKQVTPDGGEFFGRERQQSMLDVITYIIKPDPQFGTVVKTGNMNLALPMFKINRRLVNAFARYLKTNELDGEIFNSIFGEYGRAYRRRKDNIIPEEVAELARSSLHFKGEIHTDRSPLLDLLMPMGRQAIYYAPMLHRVRGELSRYADRSRRKKDPNGNMEILMQYGNSSDITQWMKMYKDPKNFMEEAGPWDCV